MQDKNKIRFQGKSYPCCTSLTMDIIGGKWKTVILYHLREGKLRYNELRKAMPTVTERTLSLQLKKLEEHKVVRREVVYKKPPLKVYYSLTELGTTLLPIVQSIADWGDYVVGRE
ncbi:MAG: helix-turn-helix transcriptional regulator [Saprospiraceae bacterium]|nr:helix-turn-helix transcriptional regulator [Saprospiraceae bacterium]